MLGMSVIVNSREFTEQLPISGRVLLDGDIDACDIIFVFAHGSNSQLNSSFMQTVSQSIARNSATESGKHSFSIAVLRFEFSYLTWMRETGRTRPPEKVETLITFYTQFVEALLAKVQKPLLLGGKSLGGRIATYLLADHFRNHPAIVGGLVFGYPFHPIDKPEKLRVQHLQQINKPLHVFQGTRDKLGSRADVESYGLPETLGLHWIETGDHDLKPLKKMGVTHLQALNNVAEHSRLLIQRCLVDRDWVGNPRI